MTDKNKVSVLTKAPKERGEDPKTRDNGVFGTRGRGRQYFHGLTTSLSTGLPGWAGGVVVVGSALIRRCGV